MLVRKTVTVDRIEGKQVMLLLENGQEFSILKDDLGSVTEGDVYTLQLLPEADATLERQELAKTLLNQILADGKNHEGTS